MEPSQVPWLHRLYFYGTTCVFLEVSVDMAITFYRTLDFKMVGYSSAFSLVFHGILCMLLERCYVWLRDRGFPIPIRALVYGVLHLILEVLFGSLLLQFHALPWNYNNYKYQLPEFHIMGGVSALEYLPVWGVLFCLGEFVYDMLLKKTAYLPSPPPVKTHQD